MSLAGVATNSLLGLIAAGSYALILANVTQFTTAISMVLSILEYFMLVNSFLAMFNLLPIYPMDGFNFITTFMKTENNFIKYSIKNGFKIILTILLVSIATDLLFGIDLLDWYLQILFRYVYVPIAFLGVL